MQKYFGGVIWTNHALRRLSERGIKQGDAWVTFRRPDQSHYTRSKGTWVYYKTFGKSKVEVVAKQNEKKQWLILSVWSKTSSEKFADERAITFLDFLFKRLLKKLKSLFH